MAEQKTGGAEYYRRIKRAFGEASDNRIAEALATSRQAVSLWKTGKSEPDGHKLIRAADVTGIQLQWFITGEERHFARDTTMRAHSGPGHDRIAAAIDAEFKRVAKEEGKEMADLVAEVAKLLGVPERNLYNYRTGKWSVPASLIPELSVRFKSAAILGEIVGEHVALLMKPLLEGLEGQLK